MIALTEEQAQQILNGLLACIPDNYKQGFNAINILTHLQGDKKSEEKKA